MARRPIVAPPAGVYMPGAETPPKPSALVAGMSLIGQRRPSQPSAAAAPTVVIADAQVRSPSETPAQDASPRLSEREQTRRSVPSGPKPATAVAETSIRYEWRVFVSPGVKTALDAATDSQEENRLIVGRACATAWVNWMKAVVEAKNLLPIPGTKPCLSHILRRRLTAHDCGILFPHYGVKGVGLVNSRMAKGLWPYVDAAILAILAARS